MRDIVAVEIIEALAAIGPPPCEAQKCQYFRLCKEKQLACTAFVEYVADRVATINPAERPTRILFLRHVANPATKPGPRPRDWGAIPLETGAALSAAI